MNRAVIAIGSNVQPQKNVDHAILEISRHFTVIARSNFIWTKAVGPNEQPDFLNGALLIETHLEQAKLKDFLTTIENDLGRAGNGDRFAARTIDLDIVAWNDQIVDDDVYTREFLRQSVREVLPELAIDDRQG